MSTARAPAPKKQVDPLGISRRLYKQISLLLNDLEGEGKNSDLIAVTTAQRVSALKAIAQIMILQQTLRIKEINDPGRAGSSVRKYASAFKTNAARGRAGSARPTIAYDIDADPDTAAD